MGGMDQARHAMERGQIVRLLQEDYAARMTTALTLLRALDALGYSLSPEGLAFHLEILAEKGYIQVWRAKDRKGYRRDRGARPETIEFAKLTARGVELLDGLVEDGQVAF